MIAIFDILGFITTDERLTRKTLTNPVYHVRWCAVREEDMSKKDDSWKSLFGDNQDADIPPSTRGTPLRPAPPPKNANAHLVVGTTECGDDTPATGLVTVKNVSLSQEEERKRHVAALKAAHLWVPEQAPDQPSDQYATTGKRPALDPDATAPIELSRLEVDRLREERLAQRAAEDLNNPNSLGACFRRVPTDPAASDEHGRQIEVIDLSALDEPPPPPPFDSNDPDAVEFVPDDTDDTKAIPPGLLARLLKRLLR